MLTVPSGVPVDALQPALDGIVTLARLLTLAEWLILAAALTALAIAVHLTRQRTPVTTLTDRMDASS